LHGETGIDTGKVRDGGNLNRAGALAAHFDLDAGEPFDPEVFEAGYRAAAHVGDVLRAFMVVVFAILGEVGMLAQLPLGEESVDARCAVL